MESFIVEPLVDFEARVLCLSSRTPVSVVIDRLLRLQSDSRWEEPITLYLLGADEEGGGGKGHRPLSALEFLTLYSVLRLIRSSIHCVALGLLRSYEPLVLAACQPGHRCLLPTSMACVGPLQIEELPLSSAPVALVNQGGVSLREQATALVRAQLDHIFLELGVNQSLWQTPMVLTAGSIITMGLADAIVPIASFSKQPEPDYAPER